MTVPRGHSETPQPFFLGTRGGSWAAWMPPAVAGLEGTCVVLPCRFEYPEELRPAAVHGLWYFGSPYPKSYPPVVARSRPAAVHESFAGRAELLGDPGLRDCSLRLWRLSPELAGKYYFRGDLGGYNQYSFSEHTTLEVLARPVLEVPPEVVAGAEVELRCRVPDNCPELPPLLGWEGAEGLEGAAGGEVREDAGGARNLLGLLRFRPRREDGGRRLGCSVAFANTSLAFEASVALDVQYEPQVVGLWGPSEVVEGARVELGCEAEGRPLPLLSWFRGAAVLREEPAAPALRLLLPRVAPAHAGAYSCVAENRHGRHNHPSWDPGVRPPPRRALGLLCPFWGHPISPIFPPPDNPDPPVVLPESRCTAGGGEGVRCVCSAAAVPEAAVLFELPSRNLTVAEGHRDFAAAPRGGPGTGGGPGGVVTGILTLRGALEPRLAVLCAARNAHGTTARQLRFHHPGQHRGLVWAKVGPVGAVVAFAIVIALVCYLSQSRRKPHPPKPRPSDRPHPLRVVSGEGGQGTWGWCGDQRMTPDL
uniref:Myelin associated glycoprotein n=1 Tax=Cairina moschata TaxID=8855 RepID=A0A8C3BM17_CAIMO